VSKTVEPAVRAMELRREFPGGVAVDALTLEVATGSVLALLGPNGAGKTTTIRLLNGILRPHGGWSRVLGFDPATQGDELRRRTGVLTENAGLDDRLTARENLTITARLRGIDATATGRRVDDLLERFGMRSHGDQRCQGFSTGQRRRVALARCLIGDPELVFLDEPTSGLDPAATDDVVGIISELARTRGATVVLCTHFLGEAARVADQMAILHAGRLILSGQPQQLAAEMFPRLEVAIDVERSSNAAERGIPSLVTAELVDTAGVVSMTTDDLDGNRIHLEVAHRDVIARVNELLVRRGIGVVGITTRTRDLSDVYHAVEQQLDPTSRGLRAAERDTAEQESPDSSLVGAPS